MEEYKKVSTKRKKMKISNEMKNLNYLMNHIRYQIFTIILNISLKKHKTVTDTSSTYM